MRRARGRTAAQLPRCLPGCAGGERRLRLWTLDEMDSMERGRGAWVRRRWRNVAGPHGPGGAVPHGERASRPGGATPPLGRFGLAGEGSRDSETARALTVMIWLEMAAPAKHVSPWNGP